VGVARSSWRATGCQFTAPPTAQAPCSTTVMDANQEKPERSWWTFSLRECLLLLTIACMGIGWHVERRSRMEAEFGAYWYAQMLSEADKHGYHGWVKRFGERFKITAKKDPPDDPGP
jgi:hypothetical protein